MRAAMIPTGNNRSINGGGGRGGNNRGRTTIDAARAANNSAERELKHRTIIIQLSTSWKLKPYPWPSPKKRPSKTRTILCFWVYQAFQDGDHELSLFYVYRYIYIYSGGFRLSEFQDTVLKIYNIFLRLLYNMGVCSFEDHVPTTWDIYFFE